MLAVSRFVGLAVWFFLQSLCVTGYYVINYFNVISVVIHCFVCIINVNFDFIMRT